VLPETGLLEAALVGAAETPEGTAELETASAEVVVEVVVEVVDVCRTVVVDFVVEETGTMTGTTNNEMLVHCEPRAFENLLVNRAREPAQTKTQLVKTKTTKVMVSQIIVWEIPFSIVAPKHEIVNPQLSAIDMV
jgi:hypothetical protein